MDDRIKDPSIPWKEDLDTFLSDVDSLRLVGKHDAGFKPRFDISHDNKHGTFLILIDVSRTLLIQILSRWRCFSLH